MAAPKLAIVLTMNDIMNAPLEKRRRAAKWLREASASVLRAKPEEWARRVQFIFDKVPG